ncbi:hypothetical protein BHQ17_00090 [Mycolicibacterium holsaticum]|uniref:Uncharacterized protein n=1 Tax=Mycolicibacterium holsaticum TaxID=152142 RepID=A0A1E3S3A9_9MYCO|nr:hypothetical protein BHQ17_00090 [Mycolicibacterium holsaticum]
MCGRDTATRGGKLNHHGPQHDRCEGSGRTLDEAGRLQLCDLTAEQWDMLRECWRTADTHAIEQSFGITYRAPRYYATGLIRPTLDDEFAAMIADIRRWIGMLAQRAKANA